MFKPIDRLEDAYPKLYEKIIEEIREMMLNGQIKAGEKIPSERELADMFKVSRVPVREALKTLEFLGVVQNVRGDGMYIKNVSFEDLLEKMDFAIEASDNSIKELFEVREALEIKAVILAAERRTKEDLEQMKELIDKLQTSIKENEDVFTLAVQFHTQIFYASKNSVLLSVNQYLINLLEMSRIKTLSRVGRPSISLEYHKKIFDMISAQDSEGAAHIMSEHLRDARKEFYMYSIDSSKKPTSN